MFPGAAIRHREDRVTAAVLHLLIAELVEMVLKNGKDTAAKMRSKLRALPDSIKHNLPVCEFLH
jgi:hypothetical protein